MITSPYSRIQIGQAQGMWITRCLHLFQLRMRHRWRWSWLSVCFGSLGKRSDSAQQWGGSKRHETWNHLIGCSKKRHHPSKDMPYPISQFESSEQGSVKCKSTWENPMGSHTSYFIQLGWPMWGPRYFLKQSSKLVSIGKKVGVEGLCLFDLRAHEIHMADAPWHLSIRSLGTKWAMKTGPLVV